MPDIIQLLPDAVANQIAAGEVIQRPASAVKELMENAVDAGSSAIKLIVKDAGKTLVQVIDNGCGMSVTDARMSFERHATSKIRRADDLFAIRTMGFRGEALASIAAIAQVELKTRKHEEELGTRLVIEGSEVTEQEACSCPAGTSIAMKNLFFNVPARRNFLKSDGVELRHIIDEFQRVAIPNHNISFSLHHNNAELFHLEGGSLRQRIVAIFGNAYNQRLVPVEEDTNIIKISGFVGKPEFARKTRGEQFFFINKRFIKNAYLHHAVQGAYDELLPPDSFASYFLMMEIDPKSIDINIHPTKTEIKFEDEKSVYAILRSAVKRALGQYNIAPTLDFEQEMSFNIPYRPNSGPVETPGIYVNPEFNPFEQDASKNTGTKKEYSSDQQYERFSSKSNNNWEQLYAIAKQEPNRDADEEGQQTIPTDWDSQGYKGTEKITYQLHNKYILTHIKSGFMVIDQQRAHERILYERFLEAMEKHKGSSQQELFPQTVEFPTADAEMLKELEEEIAALGFDIREFGKNTFIIHGLPSDAPGANAKELLEGLIENYKENLSELKLEKRDNIARSMARNMSIRSGKSLTTYEMNTLIDELFACQMPYASPSGKPTITTFTLDDLDRRFRK
jgi:DNA mismatch repair protein MutL